MKERENKEDPQKNKKRYKKNNLHIIIRNRGR